MTAPANRSGIGLPTAPDDGPGLALWLVDLKACAPLFSAAAGRHRLGSAAPPDGTPSAREAAHAALRIILAGYIGVDLARRPFSIAPGGKPHLAPPASLAFSLSHCDGTALVAVSREGPVGVDIETLRTVRIAEARRDALIAAAQALCPEDRLPDSPQEARFLQAWTRLEALAKATGDGIGAVLERIRRPEAASSVLPPPRPPWTVRDLVIYFEAPRYAAIAGAGPSFSWPVLPAIRRLPCDPDWLERWISGGLPPPAPRSPTAAGN